MFVVLAEDNYIEVVAGDKDTVTQVMVIIAVAVMVLSGRYYPLVNFVLLVNPAFLLCLKRRIAEPYSCI